MTSIDELETDELSRRIFCMETKVQPWELGGLWTKDGVAIIEETYDDDDDDKNDDEEEKNILEAVDIPSILLPRDLTKKCRIYDDDTVSTSSSSDSLSNCPSVSATSNTSGIESFAVESLTFVLSSTSVAQSLDGKHRMRAITKIIDPDLESKIFENRGWWCGCWGDLEGVSRESVELEYVPFATYDSFASNTKEQKEEPREDVDVKMNSTRSHLPPLQFLSVPPPHSGQRSSITNRSGTSATFRRVGIKNYTWFSKRLQNAFSIKEKSIQGKAIGVR